MLNRKRPWVESKDLPSCISDPCSDIALMNAIASLHIQSINDRHRFRHLDRQTPGMNSVKIFKSNHPTRTVFEYRDHLILHLSLQICIVFFVCLIRDASHRVSCPFMKYYFHHRDASRECRAIQTLFQAENDVLADFWLCHAVKDNAHSFSVPILLRFDEDSGLDVIQDSRLMRTRVLRHVLIFDNFQSRSTWVTRFVGRTAV